jgi:hypothetical protein
VHRGVLVVPERHAGDAGGQLGGGDQRRIDVGERGQDPLLGGHRGTRRVQHVRVCGEHTLPVGLTPQARADRQHVRRGDLQRVGQQPANEPLHAGLMLRVDSQSVLSAID